MTAPRLVVENLSVSIGGTELLHDLSFELAPGERLGLIGGSGSGKTLTALAVAGLLPEEAEVSGSILFGDQQLVGLGERDLARLRGDQISMVFQEPKAALNPLHRLGRQMTEALALHYELSRSQRRKAALRLASQVGLGDPERIVRAYPHEVSGGQRQRAAIAAAISAGPGLLFADEPTTALDVTVQRGVLQLLRELTEGDECSLVFITHDLAVMSEVADRLLVLDGGRIIERGAVGEILSTPSHDVTRSLIDAADSTGPVQLQSESLQLEPQQPQPQDSQPQRPQPQRGDAQ